VKIRASLLTAILSISLPFAATAQSVKTGSGSGASGSAAASSRESSGGPLAFLFSRKKNVSTEAEPKKPAVPEAKAPARSVTYPTAIKDAATLLAPVPRASAKQKRIFVLGDSQGHTEFGPEFQQTLLAGGHEVLYHAVKNGTPYYWSGLWKTPVLTRVFEPAASPDQGGQSAQVSMTPHTILRYVEVYDPDVFIIQGGTNFELDLAKDAPAQMSDMLARCLAQATARGAKVLWVGPPDARDDVKTPEFQQKAAATLAKVLAPYSDDQGRDCFFDSRAACPMPNSKTGDGEHPAPAAARAWAREAGSWVLDSMRHFEKDRSFGNRKPSAPPKLARPLPFLDSLTQASTAPSYLMNLRLVAKSRIEDPKTMAYTDAFSVFKYELQNPGEVLGRMKGISLTGGEAKPFQVYVLHWTAHNDGRGASTTRVASWKEGRSVKLELTPLNSHPLRKALGTMRQYNDFDDFEAPIFVSANLLDERKF
jgi:hypothetical protein